MYTITMRIQDINSTDYECPFEAHFNNENIAKSVFNGIIKNSKFWNDLIYKEYGLTKELEPQIRLFLTNFGPGYYHEEKYWFSYEVI